MKSLVELQICPGLFYATPAQDGAILRLRTPGGIITAKQARAIAAILAQEQWEDLQITNRANLQVRAQSNIPSPETLALLQGVGLAAQNPRLDHLRNLMASPCAGIDSQEILDTRPLLSAIDNYIQSRTELAHLPAKFSLGLDGGGLVGIGMRSPLTWEHRYNEVQLTAVAEKEKIYFHLALGGDRTLQNTELFCPSDRALELVAALTQVYLEYTQQNLSPKKPRLKHLLNEWGLEKYLAQVQERFGGHLVQGLALPLPSQPYQHLGIHPQKQLGYFYVGCSLPLGQLTRQQWVNLLELSHNFGNGDLRLTPWQSVILKDIPQAKIADLGQSLAEIGLSDAVPKSSAVVACTGKPGCSAAATSTQQHARELINYLEQNNPSGKPVNIHLTGCEKLCAQSSPAEITLLGIELEDGQEGYRIWHGKHLLGDFPWHSSQIGVNIKL